MKAQELRTDGRHTAVPMPVDTYKPGPTGICARCGEGLTDWSVHLRWWERLNLTPWRR